LTIVTKLREFARNLPLVPPVYRALRQYLLKIKTAEKVFTDIYKRNSWGGKHSVSGPGSDFDQTRVIVQELSALINDLNISTMLDIPCGDFFWMKDVDLSRLNYIGADIVKELVQVNVERYSDDRVQFQCMNLISDELPNVDLIFCRDCLVHLSFADIFLALDNVCNSRSDYILTTTFTGRMENSDIVTGQRHNLNLELAPFAFPQPLRIIVEGCTEKDGAAEDKSLGLWRVADIQECLKGHRS